MPLYSTASGPDLPRSDAAWCRVSGHHAELADPHYCYRCGARVVFVGYGDGPGDRHYIEAAR